MGGAFASSVEAAHLCERAVFPEWQWSLFSIGAQDQHMTPPLPRQALPLPQVECSLSTVPPLLMGGDMSLGCGDHNRSVTQVQPTLEALLGRKVPDAGRMRPDPGCSVASAKSDIALEPQLPHLTVGLLEYWEISS